jgi:alpha-L-fucosidase
MSPNPARGEKMRIRKGLCQAGSIVLIAAAALCTSLAMTAASDRSPIAVQTVDRSTGETADNAARMQWFREAKFGMFINWGLYAVPAGEWNGKTGYAEWIMLQARIPMTDYEKFAGRFNPVKFDAKEWVRIAKDAGMKYLVITTKHHDGFCMFDSKLTDYSIVKTTPFKRDPMKELAAACHEAGLTLCFYYSVPDWHHPEFPAKYSQHEFHGAPNPNADIEKYVAYVKGQVRELLTNYGPIGILWFDGGGSFKGTGDRAQLMHAREIIDLIHQLQPQCLVNNRLGVPADYGTPEQKIPGERPKEVFEVCMTLNKHWGYNSHDKDWKTPQQIIYNLTDIVSKGGNYLLNVGPTADGIIPQPSQDNLHAIGRWLKTNGEAIYGAGPTPFGDELGQYSTTERDKNGKPVFLPKSEWRCTTKPGKLFIHLLKWPNAQFDLPGVKNRITKVYLLSDADQKPLPVKQSEKGVSISLPEKSVDEIVPVLCIEVEGKALTR